MNAGYDALVVSAPIPNAAGDAMRSAAIGVVASVAVAAAALALLLHVADFAAGRHFAVASDHASTAKCGEPRSRTRLIASSTREPSNICAAARSRDRRVIPRSSPGVHWVISFTRLILVSISASTSPCTRVERFGSLDEKTSAWIRCESDRACASPSRAAVDSRRSRRFREGIGGVLRTARLQTESSEFEIRGRVARVDAPPRESMRSFHSEKTLEARQALRAGTIERGADESAGGATLPPSPATIDANCLAGRKKRPAPGFPGRRL